jgi:hypothetical protein
MQGRSPIGQARSRRLTVHFHDFPRLSVGGRLALRTRSLSDFDLLYDPKAAAAWDVTVIGGSFGGEGGFAVDWRWC